MRPHFAVLVLLALPVVSFAQKEKIVELQRDVALLQDQVRTLQRSFDEKNAAITLLAQQTLDAVNKVNTSIALLNQALHDQEKTVAAPVVSVGAKVDQMTEEFRFVRESITDLNSKMSKLQSQLTDTVNTLKVMQAPPPPPASNTTGGAATPPPGMSSQSLYDNARRDLSAGNLDIAIQEFNDYLRYYANTDYAPNAQYYIGEVYYQKQDYEGAGQAFDAVLERYPENNKTPDAIYMKGMSLLKSDQRADAIKAFRSLIAKYPTHELAKKAKLQLNKLGVSASAASASKRRGRR